MGQNPNSDFPPLWSPWRFYWRRSRDQKPLVYSETCGHGQCLHLAADELLSFPASCRPALSCGHLDSPGTLLGGVPLKVTQSGLFLPHLCPIRSQASWAFQLGNVSHFHCSHFPFLKFQDRTSSQSGSLKSSHISSLL